MTILCVNQHHLGPQSYPGMLAFRANQTLKKGAEWEGRLELGEFEIYLEKEG